MSSMYETIMELPLFKGIGDDQLSQLLEKTSVEFLKYDDGDMVARSDQRVDSVDFILGGRVRQTYSLKNFAICVDEILGKGSVLGALNLFGLTTTYNADILALGKVNLMRITKSDYMNILVSDRIYMLNFMNFLSAASQKSKIIFQNQKQASIGRTLQTLALSFASRTAETVMVAGKDSELAKFCGVSDQEFETWKLNELSHNRIMSNQRGIFVKSPRLFK